MNALGPHIKNFNERIKVMNQTNRKDLVMTADEARNLHADIFSVLAINSELISQLHVKSEDQVIEVNMDGGGFN